MTISLYEPKKIERKTFNKINKKYLESAMKEPSKYRNDVFLQHPRI